MKTIGYINLMNLKKQQIIDCGLYECYEDYFIAYKAIRNDRYSHYNLEMLCYRGMNF